MSDLLEGFQTDLWASPEPSLGSGLYDIPVTDYTNYEIPAMITANNVTGTSEATFNNSNFSNFSFGDFLKGTQNVIDWGLKATGTAFAANAAFKNQELNSYLQKQQMDIFRTKVNSDANVAKIQAGTADSIARIKANAAMSGANALNFGAQSQSGPMFWLTVLGVLFAGIQVYRSAK